MASVFLSYDRDDTAKARPLALAFEKAGHHVWWDLHVRGGAQFSKVIEEALKAADAVVVLWSKHAVESAWVRDEAAAGRDSGRLVPATLDGTEPPLGFRQFQTIDLSRWTGRGSRAELRTLLADVESLARSRASPTAQTQPASHPSAARSLPSRRQLIAAALALFLILGAGGLYWFLAGRTSAPPTVEVVAADGAPLSQELARNLLFKLGALQGNAAANVRLLENKAGEEGADLRISVNGAGRNGEIRANVALVSGKNDAMLWSKEFERAAASRADLEESLAFAAARVLDCAIEEASGEYGRLREELRRTYLNACSLLTEVGWDSRSVLPELQLVAEKTPRFRPAWARLLNAQSDYVSLLQALGKDRASAKADLKSLIARARKFHPDMAEITLAELTLNPGLPVSRSVALVEQAKAQDPHNVAVLIAHSQEMGRVGRMADSVDDAEQAADLDPLSPSTRRNMINTLLWAGQVDRARAELERAKDLWPGTQTIRDAEFAIELRVGDFRKIIRTEGQDWLGSSVYVAARLDPTDANVARYMAHVRRPGLDSARLLLVVQELGEMNRPGDFYALLESIKEYDALRLHSYLLFRPWTNSIRSDPRFMLLAKRVGLVEYWQKSRKWPDFCSEPDLPYDCKAEAAKYA